MGPVEAGILLEAKQRQQRLGARLPLKAAFAWKPRVVPEPAPAPAQPIAVLDIANEGPPEPGVLAPVDMAQSPYGPPVPFPETLKWRAQEKHITAIVAGVFGVEARDIVSDRRTLNVVIPRQVAMYLSRMLTFHSMPRIGRAFGGRDHTTALHAIRKIGRIIEAGEEKHFRIIAKIYEAESFIREKFTVASDVAG